MEKRRQHKLGILDEYAYPEIARFVVDTATNVRADTNHKKVASCSSIFSNACWPSSMELEGHR